MGDKLQQESESESMEIIRKISNIAVTIFYDNRIPFKIRKEYLEKAKFEGIDGVIAL